MQIKIKFKEFESILWKKDAFDSAGIRARVFRLPFINLVYYLIDGRQYSYVIWCLYSYMINCLVDFRYFFTGGVSGSGLSCVKPSSSGFSEFLGLPFFLIGFCNCIYWIVFRGLPYFFRTLFVTSRFLTNLFFILSSFLSIPYPYLWNLIQPNTASRCVPTFLLPFHAVGCWAKIENYVSLNFV